MMRCFNPLDYVLPSILIITFTFLHFNHGEPMLYYIYKGVIIFYREGGRLYVMVGRQFFLVHPFAYAKKSVSTFCDNFMVSEVALL